MLYKISLVGLYPFFLIALFCGVIYVMIDENGWGGILDALIGLPIILIAVVYYITTMVWNELRYE